MGNKHCGYGVKLYPVGKRNIDTILFINGDFGSYHPYCS